MNENLIKKCPPGKIKFWYLIFVFSVLIWTGLIVLAPVLKNSGEFLQVVSAGIYRLFSAVCHQMDDRCFHISGSKMAVCSRCFSIYSGILAGSFVYPFISGLKKISIPNPFIFIVPAFLMALDFILDFMGILKNTVLTRSITGFIFGTGMSFFLIPVLIFFSLELQEYFNNKRVNK